MSINANADCTLYQAVGETGEYTRTVIRGVHWEDCSRSVRLKAGAAADDSVLLMIPMPQPAAPGKEDYVVRGVVDLEVTGTEGHRLTDLQRLYDVKAVISVDTMDMGSKAMRHWEAGLK